MEMINLFMGIGLMCVIFTFGFVFRIGWELGGLAFKWLER